MKKVNYKIKMNYAQGTNNVLISTYLCYKHKVCLNEAVVTYQNTCWAWFPVIRY